MKSDNSRYLTSCYKLVGTGGESTSDYEFIPGEDCDLDEANGFDFTGKGMFDNEGNELTGYAYLASESYPYVMPYLYGSTNCNFEEYFGDYNDTSFTDPYSNGRLL